MDGAHACDIFDKLENNGFILNSFFIPEEVLTYILSFVDSKCLVFQCRQVCKEWKLIIDSQDMWKHKVRRTESQSLSKLSYRDKIQLNLPWFLYFSIFYKDPFEKNLIASNNCGQKKLKYWTVEMPKDYPKTGNGKWCIEDVPSGSNPLPDSEDFGNNTCCFVSSYQLCKKNQIIYLNEIGITKHIIDKMQPTITVSEWYAGRYDCGCKYKLTASLLDENRQILNEKEEKRKVTQWNGMVWNKIVITFKNYGPGVRYIKFDHEGQDTQYWSGHYGSKMSGAVVMVSLPTEGSVPIATNDCAIKDD